MLLASPRAIGRHHPPQGDASNDIVGSDADLRRSRLLPIVRLRASDPKSLSCRASVSMVQHHVAAVANLRIGILVFEEPGALLSATLRAAENAAHNDAMYGAESGTT